MGKFSHHYTCQDGDPLSNDSTCMHESKPELVSTASHYNFGWKVNTHKTFEQPEPSYHVVRIIPTLKPTVTHKARSITCIQIKTHSSICIDAAGHHHSTWQSHDAQLVPSAFLSTSSGTFNSLFKVLFIFPSWYLFAIGFEPIFSLRWNLPPSLRSNPEERDS